MYKKAAVILICTVMLLLSGCSDSRRIDKASLAELVTVREENNQKIYSFYLMSGNDEPKFVDISAESFKEAVELAEKYYIPNLSLAKLEIFIAYHSLSEEFFDGDLNFISSDFSISPQMLIALCDETTMENIPKSKEISEEIKSSIKILKNKNNNVCVNSLSIFNNFNSDEKNYFYVSYITSDEAMSCSAVEIFKKMIKSFK